MRAVLFLCGVALTIGFSVHGTARAQDRQLEDPAAVQVEDADGSAVNRVVGESFAGLGGQAISLAVGLGVGAAALNCSGDFCGLGIAIVGLSVAATASVALTPLMIYLAGNANDGGGGYGWTLLGSVAGSAFGAGLLVGATYLDAGDGLIWGAAGLAIASQIVGSILGYELSSAAERTRQAPTPTLLMPTLSVELDGATAGLAGAF